jgi:O-antigen/teichoic acid export membrane protein
MKRDSRADVGLTAGTNLALAALNAASGILLARALGPEGRGEVAAIQLWGFFFATVALLGVPDAVVYLVARRRDRAGVYVTSAAVLNLLASVPIVVLGWFVMPVVLAAQSDETVRLARLFLVFVPLYAVTNQPGQGLRGLSSFTRWNLLRLVPAALWVLVVLAAMLGDQRTVAFVTAGFLLGTAVTFVVACVVAAPQILPPYRVDRQTWRPMLRFGLPLLLASVPQWLNLRLDQMLLAAFVPSRELGLYAVAVAWAGLVAPLVNALGIVLFPRLAGEDDIAARHAVLFRGVRAALVITTVLVVLLLALTPVAIRLAFGPVFVEAVPVAAVLVVATAFLSMNFVLEEGFRGLGRPSEVLRAELAGLAVTAVVLVALLGPLGILGAAVASLVGYAATTAVLGHRLGTLVGPGSFASSVPRGDDVRGVMTALVGFARGFSGGRR